MAFLNLQSFQINLSSAVFFICTFDGDAARNSARRSTVFHRRAISRTGRILCNSFLAGINLSLARARVSPLKSIGNANYVCEISQRLAGAAPSDKKWRFKSTGSVKFHVYPPCMMHAPVCVFPRRANFRTRAFILSRLFRVRAHRGRG